MICLLPINAQRLSMGKRLWSSVRILAWAGLFVLILYYIIIVLIPFYRDGIYLLSEMEIIQSASVEWTHEEISAFTLAICLGLPLFLLLGIDLIRGWRTMSTLGRTLRIAAYLSASVV